MAPNDTWNARYHRVRGGPLHAQTIRLSNTFIGDDEQLSPECQPRWASEQSTGQSSRRQTSHSTCPKWPPMWSGSLPTPCMGMLPPPTPVAARVVAPIVVLSLLACRCSRVRGRCVFVGPLCCQKSSRRAYIRSPLLCRPRSLILMALSDLPLV